MERALAYNSFLSCRRVAAVGLPGIGVNTACGSGNDVLVVVMLGMAKAGFARLVS